MDINSLTTADLRTVAASRILCQVQIGAMLCTILISKDGDKLATITRDGCSGWIIHGGIDLQQLLPEQIEETFDMGRNRTTQTAGGIPLHTLEWPGAPTPVHVATTPADGAFVLFPPGCFDDYTDTHEAALF